MHDALDIGRDLRFVLFVSRVLGCAPPLALTRHVSTGRAGGAHKQAELVQLSVPSSLMATAPSSASSSGVWSPDGAAYAHSFFPYTPVPSFSLPQSGRQGRGCVWAS